MRGKIPEGEASLPGITLDAASMIEETGFTGEAEPIEAGEGEEDQGMKAR